MAEYQIELTENLCCLLQNNALVTSWAGDLYKCRNQILPELRRLIPKNSLIELLLDVHWVKKEAVHFEEVDAGLYAELLRAQAAQRLNIPEPFVNYYLRTIKQTDQLLQGELYCVNSRELQKLKEVFIAYGLGLFRISAKEYPEAILCDCLEEKRKEALSQNKIIMIGVLLLMGQLVIGGANAFLNRNARSELPQASYQQLKKENSELRRAFSAQKNIEQVRVGQEKPTRFLKQFLTTFPQMCRGRVIPQVLNIDLKSQSIEIQGIASDLSAGVACVEKMKTQKLVAEAVLTDYEQRPSGYQFKIEAKI